MNTKITTADIVIAVTATVRMASYDDSDGYDIDLYPYDSTFITRQIMTMLIIIANKISATDLNHAFSAYVALSRSFREGSAVGVKF